MAVKVVITPVLQKAEKCRFYQEIWGCYKIRSQIEAFHLNAFLYVLTKHLCEEKINAEFHLQYISVWSIGNNGKLFVNGKTNTKSRPFLIWNITI